MESERLAGVAARGALVAEQELGGAAVVLGARGFRADGDRGQVMRRGLSGADSLVLRVPRLTTDEDLALGAVRQTGIVIHPGYFFDFSTDGLLVLSLLPEPASFAESARRLAAHLEELIAGSG